MPMVHVQQSVVSSVYACVTQWSNCVGRNVNTDVIVMIVKIVQYVLVKLTASVSVCVCVREREFGCENV